jgi:hypothetical protein
MLEGAGGRLDGLQTVKNKGKGAYTIGQLAAMLKNPKQLRKSLGRTE